MTTTPASSAPDAPSLPLPFRQFIPLIAALIILQITFRIAVPNFWSHTNLIDLAQQISVNAIIAFGMTFTILIRGIDLSVGALLALVGTAAAWAAVQFNESSAAFLIALAVGMAVAAGHGALNGSLVAYSRIPAFIVTLATMLIARGLGFRFHHAEPLSIPMSQTAFLFLGSGKLFGLLPFPIVIMLTVFIVNSYWLHCTSYGRHLYALGGNPEAARYAGIPAARRTLSVFVICSLCAGLAGLVQTSQLYASDPAGGIGYELNAIAAAVVGGASLAGGSGTMFGTLLGALIIGTLDKGLNQAGVHFSLQYMVKGLVILGAVFSDMWKSKGQ